MRALLVLGAVFVAALVAATSGLAQTVTRPVPGDEGVTEIAATIEGTPGDDVIRGTAGSDVIAGLGGNDRIWGLGGDDLICGGLGDDRIDGGGGDDFLVGNFGDDTLLGGTGDDALFGDAFFDDSGAFDTCNGQQGFDLSAACEVNNQMEGELEP